MKIYPKAFLVLILVCYSLTLQAQKKQGRALIDTLLTVLPTSKEDTFKVNVLSTLASSYHSINTDEAIKYATQGLELATKLGMKNEMATLNSILGDDYLTKGDYPKALDYYLKALKTFNKSGFKPGIAQNTMAIGAVYSVQGSYAKALDFYLKALKLYEEIAFKTGIAAASLKIGVNYENQSYYTKALEYDFKALKIYEEQGDKNSIAAVNGDIGILYTDQNNYLKALEYYIKELKIYESEGNKAGIANGTVHIGNIYAEQEEYNKALEYYIKALKTYEELGDKNQIATITSDMGLIYYDKENYEKAMEYDNKALSIDAEIGDKGGVAILNNNIGNVYCKQKNYALAIECQQKAIKIASSIKSPNILENAYLSLAEDYRLTGDYGNALKYTDKYHTIKDSIFSKNNGEKIVKLEAKAEFDHREDSLQLTNEKKELTLQKEIQLNALTYEYKTKQQAAKTEKEKEELKYEEVLKQDKVKFDFDQKQLVMESDKRTVALAEQKKEVQALQRLQEQKVYTYIGLLCVMLMLGFSFFIMRERRKSERARKKSDELLLNILPAEIAKELKVTGYSKARHFDNVTVMLTDFVDFTIAGEHMTPQELVDELDTCFIAFDAITSQYNIEKIKTIGDAYLAVCGLPLVDVDHALNIIRAAQDIRTFMARRHAELGPKSFKVRIGAHSGNVVAGIVGVKKFAYDIWGDTVNTAARMEQNSEGGKINISETTYVLVKDQFACTYRGEIKAKNKGHLKMYFVE